MAESEKVLKSLLKRVKESKKDDWKLTIKKKKKKKKKERKIMANIYWIRKKAREFHLSPMKANPLRNKMILDFFSLKDICIYYLHILLSSKIPTALVL